ncbi:hypothetical protein JTE90_002538 [Oedothorax gibbosus]|uniref:Uncharacterized protein n=1 Tax=Oedothorax gibbosus TaxID=931172 RepID=A0AAV6V5J4_9ARAC|nr:hypothetical protein JTE90_002538 [Oedothorax gibbosus]
MGAKIIVARAGNLCFPFANSVVGVTQRSRRLCSKSRVWGHCEDISDTPKYSKTIVGQLPSTEDDTAAAACPTSTS